MENESGHEPASTVEYVDHMGDDLSIVNAARVSLGRRKETFDEDDARLLVYLVKNEHTSPFRHAFVTLRVTCPIFVERQWFKHQVGCAANSISGRYVQYNLGYWVPETLRKGSPAIKQGSLEEPVEQHEEALQLYRETCEYVWKVYERMINEYGVCKEQARSLLGLNTNTQFVFSASIQAWFHFYRLRTSEHAQAEIREYAHNVGEIVGGLFPHTWECLLEHGISRGI
jgi:thymidylate synthase (FAD)